MASHKHDDVASIPISWEIRWDFAAGARIDDEGDVDALDVEGSVEGAAAAAIKGPMIALGPNGPWVGWRRLTPG